MRLKFVFSIAVFLFLALHVAMAQPGGGGPGGGGDPDVPITGLEYLLIAGGILGAKRLIKSRRESK